jgi:hypothetical protein
MKLVSWFAGAAVFASAGCYGSEAPPSAAEQKAEYPLAGLYVPGSEIGLTEERRSAIAAAMNAGASGGLTKEQEDLQKTIQMAALNSNKCKGAVGTPGTPGKLDISFTTASYFGRYKPENCGAVWIEDIAGNYIATPAIWARIRTRPLFFYQAVRCQADQPDEITSATLPDHNRPHAITWDGKDLMDIVVPDGMYVLNIEVTEDEADAGRRTQYPFMKSAAPMTVMPPDTEAVKGLKIVFTPEAATPTGPSTGG